MFTVLNQKTALFCYNRNLERCRFWNIWRTACI